MEINYFILAPVLIALVVLVIYLVRRNRKDEKTFEKEMNETEVKAESHDGDQV